MGGDFDFYRCGLLFFQPRDQTLHSQDAHFLFRHMDGGQAGFDNIAEGNVVKAYDGNILRDAVSPGFQGTHGAYGDQVIVGKVASRKLIAPL